MSNTQKAASDVNEIEKPRAIPPPKGVSVGRRFADPDDPAIDYEFPVQIKLISPLFISGKQINIWDAKNDTTWRVKLDWERQIVWFRCDTGTSIGIGWTPFHNIQCVAYGILPKHQPAADVPAA